MPYLPSLPKDSTLLDVFKTFPDTATPLIEYQQILMRWPSPLTVAQRELIAAYVSGLNQCAYCHSVHTGVARMLGVAESTLTPLPADIERADVDEEMKPILRYVGKLTTGPATLTQADADAVFAADWSERALHDAVSICALFNFVNRLVEGLGVKPGPNGPDIEAKRLVDNGYVGLLQFVQDQDR